MATKSVGHEELEPLFFEDRAGWRDWLEEHHADATEAWLVYYKKHTGKPSVKQAEGVEEALCFGWIDGKVRRIDDERYMQRYTPRKPRSIWSERNKQRVKELIKAGRMTPAGMALVKAAKKSGQWSKATETHNAAMHPGLEKALAKNKRAQTLWEQQPPSHRKHYLWWINDAKREETQLRRIDKAMQMLLDGKKPGMG